MAKSGQQGGKTAEKQIDQAIVHDTGSMDKIRDILFGQQMRELEKRFAKLEGRIDREADNLRRDMLKRIDSLEAYVKSEIEALAESLGSEAENREEGLQRLAEDLKEHTTSLQKRLSKVDENLNRKTKELRQQILEQSKSLLDELDKKQAAAAGRLDAIATELRRDKVACSDLAEYFSELALRLSNDKDLKAIMAAGE